MSRYLKELEEKGLSLLIYRGDEVVFSSTSGGIMPLLDAIDIIGRDRLCGTIVADKIVGKAAALLILYMLAAEVHTVLISTSAKEVLCMHRMKFRFAEETPAIRNRDGTDTCPFERLVLGVFNPGEAYGRIKTLHHGWPKTSSV